MAEVKVLEVERKGGNVLRVRVLIGDKEVTWGLDKNGRPTILSRTRYGVRVFDYGTLYIEPNHFMQMKRVVEAIFRNDKTKIKSRGEEKQKSLF